MPIADYKTYREILDRARAGRAVTDLRGSGKTMFAS
jgi:hypothetical protein